MENISNVFVSTLDQVIKKLIHPIMFYLIQIDDFCAHNKQEDEILDFIYHQIREDREIYFTLKPSFQLLVDLAEKNPTNTVYYLTKKVKDCLNQQISNILSSNTLKQISNFDRNSKYHKIVISYLFIKIFNRIILRIMIEYKPKDSGSFLSRTGLKIAKGEFASPIIKRDVIIDWSYIYSLISQIEFMYVAQTFRLFTDTLNIEDAFLLIQYIRFDYDPDLGVEFMKTVLNSLKNLKSKRILTNEILKYTSNLFMTFLYCEPVYNSYIEFAQQLLNDKNLNCGAVLLLSTIYANSELDMNVFQSFVKTSVLPLLSQGKSNYALLSLRNFMIGKKADVHSAFFSDITKSLGFIKANTLPQVQSKESYSFVQIFMNSYYYMLNFEMNNDTIVNILVHFASLDFQNFASSILPFFLKLEPTSPKFLTFLKTVPLINSPDFSKNSISKAEKMYLTEFNRLIKLSIINEFIMIVKERMAEEEKRGFSFISFGFLQEVSLTCFQADSIINELLEQWHMQKSIAKRNYGFNFTNSHPKVQDNVLNVYLECIKCVFTDEEYSDPAMLSNFLFLLTNKDFAISKISYDICFEMYSKKGLLSILVDNIHTFMTQPEQDVQKIFMRLRLLHDILSKSVENLTEEDVNKLTIIILIWCGATYPEIRLLIYRINSLLYFNKKIFSQVASAKWEDIAQNRAKRRLSFYRERKTPGIPPIPEGSLSHDVALACHYPMIWLNFCSELTYLYPYIDLATKKQLDLYLPAFISSLTAKPGFGNYMDIYTIMAFLSIHLNKTSLSVSNNIYDFDNGEMIEAAGLDKQEDFRPAAFSLLLSLLSHKSVWCTTVVFLAMPLCHPYFYASIFSLLPNIKKELIPQASKAMINILCNGSIDMSQIKPSLGKISNFVSALHSYFTSHNVNTSRLLTSWDKESELTVQDNIDIILDFCQLILQIFDSIPNISSDEWAISTRQVSFRFFVNWSYTKSEKLELLRKCSILSIRSLLLNGRVFTDPLFFDESTVDIIAMNDLLFCAPKVLEHHLDILLIPFIDSGFLKPIPVLHYFVEAIMNIFKTENINYLYYECPSLILLGMTLHFYEPSFSSAFLMKLLSIYNQFPEKEGFEILPKEITNETIKFDKIAKYFSFATEAIFALAFYYLTHPHKQAPTPAIVEAILPFVKYLRLLPKQKHCVQHEIEEFSYFTPYQFLEELMKVTEKSQLDEIDFIILLWKELLKSPDHADIIPTYILQNERQDVVFTIAVCFLEHDNNDFAERIVNNLSFARIFDIENFLKSPNSYDEWTVKVLCKFLGNPNIHILDSDMPTVIHYAFMFSSSSLSLLNGLCTKFGLSLKAPAKYDEFNTLKEYMTQIISQLTESQKEELGVICMKGILGYKDIKRATLSLSMFNLIMTPIDDLTLSGVCKCVTYHLANSSNDINQLCFLVSGAFEFYSQVVEGNEDFCFDFFMAFLDCKIFFDTLFKTGYILLDKLIKSEKITEKTWNSLLQITRPLIFFAPKIPKARVLLNKIIQDTNDRELLLAAAPIRKTYPNFFDQSQTSTRELIYTSSQIILNRVLNHYSIMLQNSNNEVLDAIFLLSTNILGRIQDIHQCQQSLAKIYQSAVLTLGSQSAIIFIQTIAKIAPAIANLQINAFSDWSKSIDEIIRDLTHLYKDDQSTPLLTITDCRTIHSVYNILNSETVPRIIPYSTQREMVEGMITVSKSIVRKRIAVRRVELLRSSAQQVEGEQAKKKKTYKRRDSNVLSLDLSSNPLIQPKQLLPGKDVFQLTSADTFIPTIRDFMLL